MNLVVIFDWLSQQVLSFSMTERNDRASVINALRLAWFRERQRRACSSFRNPNANKQAMFVVGI